MVHNLDRNRDMNLIGSQVVESTDRTPLSWRFDLSGAVSIVLGVALSVTVCRFVLPLGHGEFLENHDGNSYGMRLIEFRECFANGYWFPQWCGHFRGGLGAPFFCFYQPFFFYVASLTPPSWPVAQQLGGALLVFSLAGYVGMWCLVSPRLGAPAGILAGTFLLTAPYVHTELDIRGDLSEYAGMMLIPGLLAAFLRYCERPTRGSGIVGAAMAASIVMTHPGVALVTYGLLALAVIIEAGFLKSLQRVKRGALILAWGVGMSAHYWWPVFLESRYASVERMWNGQDFDGYYHFSRHFVSLMALFDRSVTQTPIPVKLGMWPSLIAGMGLVVALLKWTCWDDRQQHLIRLCIFLLGASLFLMSPQSVVIWEHLPLLSRIQFPWRLLTLVSVAMAGLVGVAVAGVSGRGWQWLSLLLLCGLLIWPERLRSRPSLLRYDEPRSAVELADQFVAPDLADEWLPRDAQRIQVSPKLRQPFATPPMSFGDYRLWCGGLECELKTSNRSTVVLPHYYFPVGFSATLAGQTIPLERTPRGLMRIVVPANSFGTLRVEWNTSPAKRVGIALTVLTSIVGVVMVWRKTE